MNDIEKQFEETVKNLSSIMPVKKVRKILISSYHRAADAHHAPRSINGQKLGLRKRQELAK